MAQFRVFVFSLDLGFSKTIKNRLSWFGLEIYIFKSLNSFWQEFYESRPDLLVIDDFSISRQVFALIKKLNEISSVPIILFVNNQLSLYEIFFFDIEHVIKKPFYISSLDVKISKILNSSSSYLPSSEFKSRDSLSLNIIKKKLTLNTHPIGLTKTEFNIFSLLLAQKDQKYVKSILLRKIWNYEESLSSDSNNLETHFSKIKKKLKCFLRSPRLLARIKEHFVFYL